MINGWNIVEIMPVGQTANSFALPANCYYCTAAALQKLTCNQLVQQSEVMQDRTGNPDAFKELFEYELLSNEFHALGAVTHFLIHNLGKHQAVALGYKRNDGSDHMIVVYKSETSVDGSGNTLLSPTGYLRHIDYQTPNPQPDDGIIPELENVQRFIVFHRK